MTRPKNNNFRLPLSEDKTVVQLTVKASSPQKAIELYENLEKAIIQMMRVDLELDWEEDDQDKSKKCDHPWSEVKVRSSSKV